MPHSPRTLTEALRTWSAPQLGTLLSIRKDLTSPAPTDLSDLAARCTTALSTKRALDDLNAWQRLVLEALAAVADPASVDQLTTLLPADAEAIAPTVVDLRDRALLWGTDDQLHLVRSVREVQPTFPLGLAPASASPLPSDQITELLASCGTDELATLERLLWSPTGAVRNADRPVTHDTAQSPVERLLVKRLLRPLDRDTVILPREVAWLLRSHRPTAVLVSPDPPALISNPVSERSIRHLDQAAAGAAFGLVHDVEFIAQLVSETPYRLLRNGGVSSRDTAVLTRGLGGDPAYSSFVVECASATGLLGPGSENRLLPTVDYDRWISADAVTRWRELANAWLGAARFFSVSAESGGHPLGPEAEAHGAPALRLKVLQIATTVGTGRVVELETLAAATAWHRPRLTAGGSCRLIADQVTQWTWREATWLGLAALGSLTDFAAPTLAGSSLPDRLTQLFPRPVETFVIQADLTAVAPGPLAQPVARRLRLLANQESRGGGGVFRFDATSLRRALDTGWSVTEIDDWLDEHSTSAVPQPLRYLINDVARRHGSVRIGPAGSFLRVDDPTQAALLVGHPAAAGLGLRQIAPGVLVALAEETEVVLVLHELGHSPVVEDAGGVVVTAPTAPRASVPRRAAAVTPMHPDELAETLLGNERAHPIRAGATSAGVNDEAMDRLRSASEQAHAVRVVYVLADGSSAVRELAPLDLAAGTVRAVDRENAQVITIPLARIRSVDPAGSTT